MRKLEASDVEFTISVAMDDTPVRGNAMASGDDELDRTTEDEILRRLENGDPWAWGVVTVTASWSTSTGDKYKGRATLSCCSYASEKDFVECGDYLPDMKREALGDLNERLGRIVATGRLVESELAP